MTRPIRWASRRRWRNERVTKQLATTAGSARRGADVTANGRRVAVITGAGSGIGRAVATTFMATGYEVVLAGRNRDALETTSDAAREGGRALIVPTDVSDEPAVESLFQRAVAELGRVDVLFNNAGVFGPPAPMPDVDLRDWQVTVDVNLTGAFLCAREAMRRMRAQEPKGGRIINVGSISAHSPRPHAAAYTVTKHAITGLTKQISLDGRPDRIACSQIDVGNAATDMTERMAAGVLQADGTTAVEPRIDVSDVARAVLYIAGLPLDANVQSMVLMATAMPFIGRG